MSAYKDEDEVDEKEVDKSSGSRRWPSNTSSHYGFAKPPRKHGFSFRAGQAKHRTHFKDTSFRRTPGKIKSIQTDDTAKGIDVFEDLLLKAKQNHTPKAGPKSSMATKKKAIGPTMDPPKMQYTAPTRQAMAATRTRASNIRAASPSITGNSIANKSDKEILTVEKANRIEQHMQMNEAERKMSRDYVAQVDAKKPKLKNTKPMPLPKSASKSIVHYVNLVKSDEIDWNAPDAMSKFNSMYPEDAGASDTVEMQHTAPSRGGAHGTMAQSKKAPSMDAAANKMKSASKKCTKCKSACKCK